MLAIHMTGLNAPNISDGSLDTSGDAWVDTHQAMSRSPSTPVSRLDETTPIPRSNTPTHDYLYVMGHNCFPVPFGSNCEYAV